MALNKGGERENGNITTEYFRYKNRGLMYNYKKCTCFVFKNKTHTAQYLNADMFCLIIQKIEPIK